MPKKVLHDIVVKKRRRGHSSHTGASPRGGRVVPGNDKMDMHESGDRAPTKAMWLIAAASALSLAFVLLSVFSGTVVNLIPLEENVILNRDTVLAATNKQGDGADTLEYKTVVLKSTDSISIPATLEKEFERKASGKIIIYNAFSSKSQKLIKRTRFEAPNGKIYRINKSVVVPGTTVENGQVVPGSVEVTVYADEPGEEYNIGLVDFTIPGFKGMPQYEKFYARSKTPMEGGYSGKIKYASEEDIDKALDTLKASMKQSLLEQAISQVPDDFILYNDAVVFTFTPNTNPQDENVSNALSGKVTVSATGKLYGVLFDKRGLSNYIARKFSKSYKDGDTVSVVNLEKLQFAFVGDPDPASGNSLSFTLTGEAKLVWSIDKDAVAAALVGKDKSEFNSIISQIHGIKKANAVVRPPWENKFSELPEKITINILVSKEI